MAGEIGEHPFAKGLVRGVQVAKISASRKTDGAVSDETLEQGARVRSAMTGIHEPGSHLTERGALPEPDRAVADVGIVREVEQRDAAPPKIEALQVRHQSLPELKGGRHFSRALP